MVDCTFKVFNRKDIAAYRRIAVDRRNLKQLGDAYVHSCPHWHYFMNEMLSVWLFGNLMIYLSKLLNIFKISCLHISFLPTLSIPPFLSSSIPLFFFPSYSLINIFVELPLYSCRVLLP